MRSIIVFLIALFASMNTAALNRSITVTRAERDFPVTEFQSEAWKKAKEILVARNWNGSKATVGRHFRVRMLWTDAALYVRFNADQNEPLVVSEHPVLDSKTLKLWNRDVCEIFIAPDRKKPRKYFEFEVAPTGEWIDLSIDLTSGKRETNWKYGSEMQAAAKIENGRVTMDIKIPWSAFGRKPKAGDVWLGNLFRCVGKDPTRGYLAWQPTLTKEPSFHVPEKFGEFRFEN